MYSYIINKSVGILIDETGVQYKTKWTWMDIFIELSLQLTFKVDENLIFVQVYLKSIIIYE